MNKLRRKFIKRMKYNYKRTFFTMFLFLLLLSFGVGYAYLTTNLSIDGISNVKSARWDVHFANIDVNEESVSPTTGATITNPTTIDFSLVLEEPGDFYEFTVDIVNEGTLNARISNLTFLPVLTEEQQQYYEYSITYVSGSDLAVGDGLKAGSSEKIKVRFEYKVLDDGSLYPEDDIELDPEINIEYEQGDGPQPNILNEPTFTETEITDDGKTVTVDFHATCGSGYVCKYIVDDGEEVIVDTRTVNIPFTSTGVISATVSNDSGTLNNVYNVKYDKVYVKSDGNDVTGFGTISEPYSSISRAYLMTEDTATIYVMDNITIEESAGIENGKNIAVTSCTKVSNTECTFNGVNTVTRLSSFTDDFFNILGGRLNLDNISLNGDNKESDMALINVFSGTLNVGEGTTISGGKNTQGGGAIYSEDSNVNINGGQITNNTSNAGGAMYINQYSELTMNGGVISNNTSPSGGGVFVDHNSVLTMNSGEISNNTGSTGGGILIGSASRLDMKTTGASVSNNEASSIAGAIFITNGSTVNIDNGTVSDNVSAGGGGAFWVDSGGTLNLSGGTINHNRVTGSSCGGGAIVNSGIVNIKGATISNNIVSSHNGGAIWSIGGTINMTSGLITGNTARGGGAIMLTGYRENSIKFIFSGGTISNNTAASGNGGAILLLKYDGFSAPVLTMSGNATITGNTSSSYGGGICSTNSIINMNGGIVKKNKAANNGGISSSGTYNYSSGYICKNNTPTNSYDITATNDSHCS